MILDTFSTASCLSILLLVSLAFNFMLFASQKSAMIIAARAKAKERKHLTQITKLKHELYCAMEGIRPEIEPRLRKIARGIR